MNCIDTNFSISAYEDWSSMGNNFFYKTGMKMGQIKYFIAFTTPFEYSFIKKTTFVCNWNFVLRHLFAQAKYQAFRRAEEVKRSV